MKLKNPPELNVFTKSYAEFTFILNRNFRKLSIFLLQTFKFKIRSSQVCNHVYLKLLSIVISLSHLVFNEFLELVFTPVFFQNTLYPGIVTVAATFPEKHCRQLFSGERHSNCYCQREHSSKRSRIFIRTGTVVLYNS